MFILNIYSAIRSQWSRISTTRARYHRLKRRAAAVVVAHAQATYNIILKPELFKSKAKYLISAGSDAIFLISLFVTNLAVCIGASLRVIVICYGLTRIKL